MQSSQGDGRYLACLIYRLITKGQAGVDRGQAHFEQKKSGPEMLSLQRKAMGMQLIPVATVDC